MGAAALRPRIPPDSNLVFPCFARFILLALALAAPLALSGQMRGRQGRSIGKVSVRGKLILMELNPGALGQENLFDLQDRTLRFTPERGGYRVDVLPLQWDPEFGAPLTDPNVALHDFVFPFSGKDWDALSVGMTGSIRFGPPLRVPGPAAAHPGRDFGGISVARFAQLGQAAGDIVNTVPAICVFFKPRMRGKRYVKQSAGRVLITWDLSEPYGNIQDFSWTPTVNRFQAALYRNGAIGMSYQQLHAQDAIVGVYPMIASGAEHALAGLESATTAATAPGNLALKSLRLSAVGGVLLKATLETAGPVLPAGDPGIAGISYRLRFAPAAGSSPAVEWTIAGFAPRGGTSRYFAFGPGVSREVEAVGNTISVAGMLPAALLAARRIRVSAQAFAARQRQPASSLAPRVIRLEGLRNPEVHFASLRPGAGPFPVVYEAFHYYELPSNRDLACTVIQALGDQFDFLAYYSDFRVDNQEAGTPSNGPLGTSNGVPVTGIGAGQHDLAAYCSAGRFQWGFIQPVYSGAIQMQKYPPPDAPIGGPEDVTYYEKQLDEIALDGHMPPYMYAMSQLGHEMGHRWAAFVSAKVGDETIPLGPVHWAMGLQAPVPFRYARPTEASIMGGGVWQDNHDGTYTQLDDNYYVPATGYSYLDLYLMGLISPAEVPDFFILRHLAPAGRDAEGHRVFRAEPTRITIADVIAAEGPRRPDVNHSQRLFNTGMVMIVLHGCQPSPRLIEETNGIRRQWMKYFSIATGRRATMTANP